jgi:hypothetical protein
MRLMMSALGQKQTLADIYNAKRHVRPSPKSGHSSAERNVCFE